MSVLLEQRMLDAFPDTVSDVSVSVSRRNRRALCIVLMPVAADVEPATDVDAAGEGSPINEVFYSLQGEGTLAECALRVCADVQV